MKYIPLDALVAEIRKRLLPVVRDKHYDEWEEGRNSERIAILDIIDTLEVKEIGVDFGDPKGDKSAKYIIDTKNLEVKRWIFGISNRRKILMILSLVGVCILLYV